MFSLAMTKLPQRHPLLGMECKIAASVSEWQDAFSLVHDSYVRAGLSEPRSCQMRVTPYHVLPTSSTLVAQHNGDLLGTLTLIRDSDSGVPMEIVYGKEVASARRQGVRFAEVSCLATEQLETTDYLYVFMRLMRLVAQHARFLGVERLLIVTHPRHALFYRRMMGFRPFGRQTSYPSVRGAPAVAAALDFAEVDQTRPPYYEDCFGVRIHAEALQPRPMPADVAAYFEPFTAHLDADEVGGSGIGLERLLKLGATAAACL
jgi:hypothetical protein